MAKKIPEPESQIVENLVAIRDLFPGKPLSVIIFPSKYQVSSDYFPELEKLGFEFRDNEVLGTDIQEALKRRLGDAGISYIDLFPALSKARELTGQANFYAIDDHLNHTGNMVSAREIAERLGSPDTPNDK